MSTKHSSKKKKAAKVEADTLAEDEKDDVPYSLAMMQLMAPDGYYTYLNVEKPKTPDEKLDEELVKKNYRRLSLKHHPDRRGGDEETFRALHRAQKVLLHSKLRQQYDLLGMDLDEDHHEEHDEHEGHAADDTSSQEEKPDHADSSSPDSIVSHMASATLAGILQAVVRTAMTGVVAVFLTRYRITVLPLVAFLAFVAYRVRSSPGSANTDMLSPFMIAIGLLLMHKGRTLPDITWTFTFWVGEALVTTMFTQNSLPTKSPPVLMGVAVLAFLLTLWLRGDMWKYLTLIAVEVFLAIVVALLFPIMEMILEEVMKEKMRKVGDKYRHHMHRMEAYYKNKQ